MSIVIYVILITFKVHKVTELTQNNILLEMHKITSSL